MENENQNNNPQQPMNKIDWAGDATRFFAEDLIDMFKNIVLRPVNGVKKWLAETRSQSIVNPLFMVVVGFLLSTLIPFLCCRIRIGDYFSFRYFLVNFGLMPVFHALFMTILLFIYLALKKQPDIVFAFRNSAVHVFLLTLFMILFGVIVLIFGGDVFDVTNLKFAAALMLLVAVYAISLGISALRQVLSSDANEGEKDLLPWYISPLIIVVSLWLSYLIVGSF